METHRELLGKGILLTAVVGGAGGWAWGTSTLVGSSSVSKD